MVRLDEDIKGRERILIVDDDESTCETVSLVFNRSGFLTETARTGHEAIEKARSESFNVALLDARLPDVEGLELLGPLRQTNPDMATIVVAGYASVENVVKAFNDGAWAYLTKPLNMDDMLKAVREALCRQDEALRRREMYEEAQHALWHRGTLPLSVLYQAHKDLVKGGPIVLRRRDLYAMAFQHIQDLG